MKGDGKGGKNACPGRDVARSARPRTKRMIEKRSWKWQRRARALFSAVFKRPESDALECHRDNLSPLPPPPLPAPRPPILIETAVISESAPSFLPSYAKVSAYGKKELNDRIPYMVDGIQMRRSIETYFRSSLPEASGYQKEATSPIRKSWLILHG